MVDQESRIADRPPKALFVGINGATGRMGTRLIQLIAEDPTLKLAAALEREGHPHLGSDAGAIAAVGPLGIGLSSSIEADAAIDVMIDFSLPDATLSIAERCRERGIPLVVGTTGLDAKQRQRVESCSTQIPILISPNMSRAVNLLMRLVGEAARSLGAGADIAVVERHHRTKKDAPSGTAIRLAECARAGLAASQPVHSPDASEREISVHALRVADSPGEHTAIFAMMGETLELSHRALNRDGFARGALDAARFVARKPPGLYSMESVLAH
jgi:4-hydroxy-tetrahydrodipicolinate reductase